MSTLDEQLDAWLREAHATEREAVPELRAAADMAGDLPLATAFRQHLVETEHHEELIRDRLEARGVTPVRLKPAHLARARPGTPCRLLSQALAHEHLEIAGYELLARVATLAGDQTSRVVAGAIRENECAMAERLEACFDRAVDASLREVDRANFDEQLNGQLADAHAIETRAIELLDLGAELAGDAGLADLYGEHLDESHEHRRLVRDRLDARGGSPSRFARDWTGPFAAQPDTPAQLAAVAYAFEFLEVGAYEQLKRVARRAGDRGTEFLAERIVADERAMANRLGACLERALDASLDAHHAHA